MASGRWVMWHSARRPRVQENIYTGRPWGCHWALPPAQWRVDGPAGFMCNYSRAVHITSQAAPLCSSVPAASSDWLLTHWWKRVSLNTLFGGAADLNYVAAVCDGSPRTEQGALFPCRHTNQVGANGRWHACLNSYEVNETCRKEKVVSARFSALCLG